MFAASAALASGLPAAAKAIVLLLLSAGSNAFAFSTSIFSLIWVDFGAQTIA